MKRSQPPEARQTEEFESESLRYVELHMHDSTPVPAWVLSSQHLSGLSGGQILDVGCGAGVQLKSVVDGFHGSRGIGVEPSTEAVSLLNRRYADSANIEFARGSIESLAFESDSFDLVMCWSVLHWVGRNDYLKALSELIRVTRRFLLIMDFVAAQDYRVAYSHADGLYTYKQDFVVPVLASGIMRKLEDVRWWDDGDTGEAHPLHADQLEPFMGNPLSYHARRGVIFAKDYAALTPLEESDFSRKLRSVHP